VSRTRIPNEVLDAAHERAAARARRDWPEADRLRGVIEAAGWRIVDRGTDFALSPATPPTIEEAGAVRYGASADVPSRLTESPTTDATVVLIATDFPEDVTRAVTAVRENCAGQLNVDLVIVADGPSVEQDAALDSLDASAEVVRTSARLGTGAAWNIGIRRARAAIVVLMDTSVEPTGDVVGPLLAGLEDPSVAVAGGWGLVSSDLRKFEDAPPGDVDAIEAYLMAFRRTDAVERGPVDERFRFYRNLDIWWSLVLRDEGEDRPPRRAVAVDVPAIRHQHRGWTSVPDDERARLSKRNFYRIIDRFGHRPDLASAGEPDRS
jgi:hypothetical protein